MVALKFINKASFIAILITVSLLINIFVSSQLAYYKHKADRMEQNFDASMSDIEKRISQIDSSVITTSKAISVTAKEAEKIDWIQDAIDDIGVRIRNVESAQKTISDYSFIFRPTTDSVYRDTIVINKISYISRDCESYDDKWTHYLRCIKDGKSIVEFKTHDEIDIVTYLGKRTKKFAFVRYGPRELLNSVVNKNPNGTIDYNKFAKLVKK